MRVPIVVALLAALVLASGVACAEEPTLLERIEAEALELVSDARRADVYVAAGSTSTRGVLVGDPVRLVTSYRGVGMHEKVRFVLYNGASGKATRVAADVELGIAVYDLPPGSAPEGNALEVEAAWEQHPGRLCVLTSEAPRLVILRSPNGRLDGLRVGDPDEHGLLLTARGRLLGLRNPVVTRLTTTRSGQHGKHFYEIALAQETKEIELVLDRSETSPGRAAVVDLDLFIDPSLRLVQTASPQISCVLSKGTFLPGAVVARVLDDLSRHGEIRHSYLGVVPDEAKDDKGARLVTVLPHSPAAKAGLLEGQTVMALQGRPVLNAANLTRQLVLRRPGEKIRLLVREHAKPVDVILGDRKAAEATIAKPKNLGLVTVNLTADLALFLDLDKGLRGVVVNRVYDGGAAAAAGLERGDVIREGGGAPTRDIPELLAAFNGSQGRIELKVQRAGKELTLQLELATPRPKGGAR